MPTQEAVVLSCVRTPVGRARRGSLANTSPVTLGASALRAALQRVPGLQAHRLDDVLMGCAMPEGPQGLNVGRLVAQAAGLPDSVPGATVNRFCSSGLQTIALASQAIDAGHADVIAAGGTESMSLLPMEGGHFVPDEALIQREPNAYISMGLTAERVAELYKVSREDQDAFALASHKKALEAIDAARFEDEIVPLQVDVMQRIDGQVELRRLEFGVDEGPRGDTDAAALARLKPAFKVGGSVTAGNSSQMSDGAAAAVLASRAVAEELGLQPLARLLSFAVAGVAPDVMGIGPVEAVPRALARAGLRLEDIDLIELNEAFASQALAVIRALHLDPERVNVNGGAIALGHPLGCTGAKLTATLLHELRRRGKRYGMVTMCIGAGMGAAGIFENLTLLSAPGDSVAPGGGFAAGLLAGRHVLVTGGGTGLGAAMAARMAGLGAALTVCGRRRAPLEATVAALRAAGGRAEGIPCDVRDRQRVEACIDEAERRLGPLHVLVNNAAGNFLAESEVLEPRGFDAVLSINLSGSFHCTQACGQRWIARGSGGTVLSIATTYAETGAAFVLPSAVSKAGVVAMTRSLAVEWGRHRIRLNAIAPGPIPTPGAWQRLVPDPAFEEQLRSKVPLGRFARQQELADLAVFLVSDLSAAMTGQLVELDGGARLAGHGAFNALLELPLDELRRRFAALRPRPARAD